MIRDPYLRDPAYGCLANRISVSATPSIERVKVLYPRRSSLDFLPAVYRDDPHFECMRSQPHFLRFMANLKKEWASYQRDFGSTVSKQ